MRREDRGDQITRRVIQQFEVFDEAAKNNQLARWTWKKKIYKIEYSKKDQTFISETYDRQKIEIIFNDKFEQERVMDAVNAHLMHHLLNIQRYYHVQTYKNPSQVTIQAQMYLCTLKTLFDRQPSLPSQTSEFILFSLLRIYQSVLYMLERYPNYYGLYYNPRPYNIAFTEDYQVILLNPCIDSRVPTSRFRLNNLEISQNFRIALLQTLLLCKEKIQDFKDHGLISFLEDDKRKTLNLEEQKNTVQVFMKSIEECFVIPVSLVRFLKMERGQEDILLQYWKKKRRRTHQFIGQMLAQL